jgi:hypothetical protein
MSHDISGDQSVSAPLLESTAVAWHATRTT